MKKTTANTKKTNVSKDLTPKKPIGQISVKQQVRDIDCKRECFNPWSLSVYAYWFIILFFIASTFYILGRSHDVLTKPTVNVEIAEEALVQSDIDSSNVNSGDLFEQSKKKLVTGNIADAIVDLTTLIDQGNAPIDVRILRGEAYMQSGDYSNAMVDFNDALNIEPDNAIAFFDRSLLFTRLEDYSSALNDINSALAAVADKPVAILSERDLYAKRGQLNLWLKNWDGAIADYTNSLARPEGSVNYKVYAERAEAYTANGQYQSAIDDYTMAVRIISEQLQGATTAADRERLPANAMAYMEKSAALNVQLGNTDAARSDLESARSIAIALNDTETADRYQSLINGLVTPEPVPEPVMEEMPVVEPTPEPEYVPADNM